MKKIIYGVYGNSGFGREVFPVLINQLDKNLENIEDVVFVDDDPSDHKNINYPILSYPEFLDSSYSQKKIVIAIADGYVRKKLSIKCEKDGIDPITVRAQNSLIMNNVQIGLGAVICPFVTITSDVSIGSYFHANLYSYVAHDCVVGDYVTFAPGVKCNGNVVIGDHAYIGTGAMIKQGTTSKPLTIGAGAIIGMGAVVTKDVPAGVTVVGNPARSINTYP
ncbi:acetyltransferase [Desulfoluna butyratoxydans]|uniref:Trimeric lpxa-like n=1 Tax=Desulfoluna butyratoxydans TaxID=231438 RepID=A0A4U8YU04_9BACT|nr:acetyltransferase [Desulfoluna butyratoxydans]VFQ47470.1 trimeric lpxa-like [Desulfoluna butyratoxydans]